MSPDLNIIENLMASVKYQVELRLANLPRGTERTEELYKQHLIAVWDSVEPQTLEHLYNSLPKRMRLCIAKKGKALKY